MSALPDWADIPAAGERVNGLFRQMWDLINEAGEVSDPDELADIWEECFALEKRIQKQRDIDTNKGYL